tara:strand:- start:169 stop:420 length:252 start_codon:yes stop_codon:yes gene_type:complete
MTKKKFKIEIHRMYKCCFEYESKDIQEIEDMINWDINDNVTDEMCDDFWEELGRQELEQMDVDTTDYKIYEKEKETPWKRLSG